MKSMSLLFRFLMTTEEEIKIPINHNWDLVMMNHNKCFCECNKYNLEIYKKKNNFYFILLDRSILLNNMKRWV